MESYAKQWLETIRPWFWQGDYNFLWIYLVILIILIHCFLNLKDRYTHHTTFKESRVQKHKATMQEVWTRKQEELISLSQSSQKPESPQEEVKTQENKEKNEEKKETKQKSPKNSENPDDHLSKLKRKTDYFSGTSSSTSYKPNLRDRYPQVYKRKGG